MISEFAVPRKADLSDTSTYSEFVSKIIREAVPVGTYQRSLTTLAAAIIKGQNELALHFLPFISCNSVGGDPEKAVFITAAWQFIRLAAKLLDDVEDGEIRDSSAKTINLGTGFLFAAHTALGKLIESGISCELANSVIARFNHVCLHTCAGQDEDLSFRWNQRIPTPDDWIKVALAKSGMLFAWASWAGSVVAGVDKELQNALWEYGLHLGVLVQIADDYKGTWNTMYNSDLCYKAVTLPLSYAYFVASSEEKEILLHLLQEANQGETRSISKARDLISDLGAQRFVLAAAQIQRYRAIEMISPSHLSRYGSQKLIALLNEAFPVLVHLPGIPNENNS